MQRNIRVKICFYSPIIFQIFFPHHFILKSVLQRKLFAQKQFFFISLIPHSIFMKKHFCKYSFGLFNSKVNYKPKPQIPNPKKCKFPVLIKTKPIEYVFFNKHSDTT